MLLVWLGGLRGAVSVVRGLRGAVSVVRGSEGHC